MPTNAPNLDLPLDNKKNTADKPLVLVDGSSYLFRAFHALPALTNVHGEPTGAMHGVLNMLDKLRRDYDPDHMVVIFDAKGKTFRNDLYPKYKAHRPPMPDDLRMQIEPLHEIVRALGYPLLVIPDVEADDVIGTLAVQHHGKVIISTGDKDMAQLVNERVSLINTMNNTLMDIQGVHDKFDVSPEQIRDYLTLIGDTVDNVPGVPKVGPKTAAKWLKLHGSLDTIMQNAASIKGKVGENLRASLDYLPLSYELVTIKCDVALGCQPNDLQIQEEDTEKLAQLYQRYGFRTRLKTLQNGTVKTTYTDTEGEQANDSKNGKYSTILTEKAFSDWLKKLEAAELFAFDTETSSLNYIDAEIVGLSFSIKTGEAAYLPLAHDYEGAPPQLERETTLQRLKPLLEDPQQAKLGHHLKYDRNVLANHGIDLNGIRHDSMLESYIYDSTASRHDLDSLAKKHLAYNTIHFEDVAGKGKKQVTFNKVPLEKATPYAAEDADISLRLHQHFYPKLEQQQAQHRLYHELEIPLINVLSRMEQRGVHIDRERLAQQSHELAETMAELEQQAYERAGENFNLSSPKQLQAILFEKQGLPVLRKTPKGQASTAEDVLQELAQDYDLPRLILDYRSLSKLRSTYTEKLPQQINPKTGRVHTSYHQAVTATGRLSSSDPNLQNIPIRSPEGRRIRQAFTAPKGSILLAADYSQIELRIMAHLSQDEGLLSAFAAGKDIHRATAAEVFGVELDAVEREQRRSAKAINFGLIYGMSAFGLAKQLGIERSAAQDYVDRYFARYPGVKRYMNNTREQAKSQGYVETLFGRRLYLPEIKSRNARRRQYAERTAINAPMQGTAADIIKRAMLSLDQWLQTRHLDVHMIMQVHDELVFEIAVDSDSKKAEAVLNSIQNEIKVRMENAAQLAVPLLVDIDKGANWDEAH